MAIVGDSGAIYAVYDRRDEAHAAVRRAVESISETILIPSVVLTEIDYLLRVRIGVAASLQFLRDLADGAFQVEAVGVTDLKRCTDLISKYADLDLGLCDAAVVAVAERLRIKRLLTVDERDFRAVPMASGEAFTLLPADLDRP
jgi:uncharacterized protein